jgi:hypothetical protein
MLQKARLPKKVPSKVRWIVIVSIILNVVGNFVSHSSVQRVTLTTSFAFGTGPHPSYLGVHTTSESDANCRVGQSTVPAQFTNYSDHIVPQLEELFDFHAIPILRHTRNTINRIDKAVSPTDSSRKPFVTCSMNQLGNWNHFPHTAQQILRCWSLWQAYHPTHQPVLVGAPMTGQHHTFVEGMLNALVQTGDVQFRSWSNVTRKKARLLASDTSVSGTPQSVKTKGSDFFEGYKMSSAHHAVEFRDHILSALDIRTKNGYCQGGSFATQPTSTRVDLPPPSPRIGILNRETTRRILNVDELTINLSARYNNPSNPQQRRRQQQQRRRQLRTTSHGTISTIRSNTNRNTTASTGLNNIKVFTMEGKSFAEQVQAISDVDILIAPHGAALVNVIFLPKCAGVLELNPKGFENPMFFGSLAAISNHAHATLYTGDREKYKEIRKWMRGNVRRDVARSRDLCPNVDMVLDAVSQLEEQWRACCQQQPHYHQGTTTGTMEQRKK